MSDTIGRPDRPTFARRQLGVPLGFLLFLVLPLRTLRDPIAQIRDPGTGWHLIEGRRILDGGSVPSADVFSFTATGFDWVNFAWLFQAIAAGLERLGGLPLYTAATILIYSTISVLLFQRMQRMGVGCLLAALFAILAQIFLMQHSLARPHIITYVFFAILVDRLHRFNEEDQPAMALWWLPLLAAFWCNLHGGFVISLVLVGLYAAVASVSFGLTRAPRDRRRARVFIGFLVVMSIATLLNPSGIWLHISILDYLGMESTPYFEENSAFAFGPGLNKLIFEVWILGFIVLLASRARLAWAEAVILIFLLHESFQAMRHANLFVIAVVPILAREAVCALERAWPALGPMVRRRIPAENRLTRRLLYGGFCAGFLALAAAGALPYEHDFDNVSLSTEAVAFIESNPDRFERPFNTDDLGGPLIYRFWPRVRVFVDDRGAVYGDRFVIDEYLKVFWGQSGWQAVLDKWQIQEAVVNSASLINRVMEASPNWAMVHRDEKTTIFFRAAQLVPSAPRG